jgi:hypothetical protein
MHRVKMTEIVILPLTGERQGGESDNAVIACNDWLRLGPGRSIPALLAYYQDRTEIIKNFQPPSTSAKTLGSWSSRYDWPERAAIFDVAWDQTKTEERAAELNFGLALDYERIRKLKRLADFLEAQIYTRSNDGTFPNVWCPDVKVVGKGDAAEVIDIERFNSSIFLQYRGVLDDLAKEVGGRVAKSEISGANGGPLETVVRVVYEDRLRDDSNPDY